MLGEVVVVVKRATGGSNSVYFFVPQTALQKLWVGTAHPDGIIGAGPCALGLLDFCLGPAHPRPDLLTPVFHAYLQFYEMGTSKSGTWDLGTGPSTFWCPFRPDSVTR